MSSFWPSAWLGSGTAAYTLALLYLRAGADAALSGLRDNCGTRHTAFAPISKDFVTPRISGNFWGDWSGVDPA
ncbi:hypothetical protein C8R47DRAFT_1225459 [Mycena vitilis]|nr:hypothetical protein C8R47DRAFT_1225459 [Mycena vitilis]